MTTTTKYSTIFPLGLLAGLLVFFAAPLLFASPRDKIVVVGDKSWTPLIGVDADGQARGMIVDIWKLWSEKTGIEVEFRLMDWAKALRAVEDGHADVVAYMISSVERKKRFDFSNPYIEIPSVIFYDESICCPKDIADLHNIEIGVVRSDYLVAHLQEKYPGLRLRQYPSYEDVIEAALSGEIKAFAMDTPVGQHHLSKRGKRGRFNILEEQVYSIEHRAAVKKGNAELLRMVGDGLASITDREMQSIVASWSGKALGKPFPWKRLAIAALTIVILTALVVVWNWQLRRKVDRAVAEIQEKQSRVEASEREYYSLFVNAIEGIYQSSFEGRFLGANPAMARILGYDSPDELMGGVTDIKRQLYVRPEDREALLDRLRRGETVSCFETEILKKDGSKIWVLMNAHVEDDNTSCVSRIKGMVLDITEQKNAMLATQKAKEEAERADRTKSEMLFSVSHELKTPLTTLFGFIKILDKKYARHITPNVVCPDEKCRREIELFARNMTIILTDCERLRRLITEFFDLAELKSGLVAWEMGPVPVEALLIAALDECRGAVQAKGLELVAEVEDGTPNAFGCPQALAKALGHLLSNAIKFTASGSIVCKAVRRNDAIEITVTDSGPGIAPEDLPHVFEPFSQGGDALTGKPTGVGLGLAVAAEIIRQHNGEIRVESAAGRGSAFTITLPLFPLLTG